MINNVTIVGRLSRDLELRYTSNGKPVASGTIAVNRPFSNQQGDREADFIQIVIWNLSAENAANFVGKGSLIGITGRIQTRSFDNNEGKRQFVTEVVCESVQFLEPKSSQNNRSNATQGNQSSNQSSRTQQAQNKTQDPFNNDPFHNTGQDDNDPFGDLPF